LFSPVRLSFRYFATPFRLTPPPMDEAPLATMPTPAIAAACFHYAIDPQ